MANEHPAPPPLSVCPLPDLAVIGVEGTDARKFMQGQLTCDVRKLTPGLSLLGGCTTGQARVQAVVTLFERGAGLGILLPRALAGDLVARFVKSTFASKVSFSLCDSAVGWLADPAAHGLSVPDDAPGATRGGEGVTVIRFWGCAERYVVVAEDRPIAPAEDGGRAARAFYEACVREGIPMVHAATSGQFVPQMLNLDLLGAVSYDKGCYVGQEVVARARRGGVPRRTFAFTVAGAPPAPGTPVLGEVGEVGSVLEAAGDGAASELLAVVDLAALGGALYVGGLVLSPAPLPYVVPLERK
jgi:tRNA-modifying protein YgfZ